MDGLYDILTSFKDRLGNCAIIYRSGVRRHKYSYGDIYQLAMKFSAMLAESGVNPGDRVLLWGPNHPCWAIAYWGIIARGAVVVPIDFMSGAERGEGIAALSGAVCAVQSRFKQGTLKVAKTVVMEDLEQLLKSYEPAAEIHAALPEDLCELVYTSGTTGAPKGVALSHRNLLSNVMQVSQQFPTVTAEYRFLSLLPLSHMFEQTAGFLTPLFLGGSVIYLRTLKPSAIMEAFAEEDVYAMVAVPRLLQLLKGSVERELDAKGLMTLFNRLTLLSSGFSQSARKRLFFPVQKKFGKNFKVFVSGGAPLSPDTFRFWNSLGFTVVEGYGLSETSPVLATNKMDQQVCGAVGWPVPGVELRLQDGEVQARGDNVFRGYFGNEAATKEAFTADGWFRTGDLGGFVEDGALVIKGRAKEVIVTGAGINVYPDELEAILLRIQGVRDACVIGFDRGSGEEVHAVLVDDDSGRRLDDVIAEANSYIDDLHRITGFSVWPDQELPKTTTLKVQKFLVRKRLLEAIESGSDAAESSDKLCLLIAQVLGVASAEVKDESYLVADLGLTSIARLELANAIEQEFRMDMDDAAIGVQTRVGDLRVMIARREKPVRPPGLRLWAVSGITRRLRCLMDSVLHYPLYRFFVNIRPEGLENLVKLQSPVMLIANHVSYLDQPTIMFALPPELRYRTATAAWAEFFFPVAVAPLMRFWKKAAFEYCAILMSVFPLPQSSGFRASMQHMGRLVDRGNSLLLFPEGERTENGTLLPFRQGLGVMVQELGIAVIPVAMKGLEEVMPRGSNWPKRGAVRVIFGEPIDFSGKSAAEIVRDAEAAVKRLTGS